MQFSLAPASGVAPPFEASIASDFSSFAGGAQFVPSFEMFVDMDLSKAVVDKATGRIHVRGIASDNSADFQRDVVASEHLQTALEILNRGWGKFNFEHHDENVGEITRVGFISAADARTKYGIECVGTCLEIEGFVYAVTPETSADSDIREIHKLVAAKARLGFSLQGGPVKRTPYRAKDGKVYSIATPSFVNKVAITGQPINMNTVCLPLAKSLSAMFGRGDQNLVMDVDSGEEAGAPPLLILGDNSSLVKDMGAASGGLTSSGAQAVVGSDGGDATRLGTSEGGDVPLVCNVCACQMDKKHKHCPNCGALSGALRKSLDTAFAPFSQLPVLSPQDSMQDLRSALQHFCSVFG